MCIFHLSLLEQMSMLHANSAVLQIWSMDFGLKYFCESAALKSSFRSFTKPQPR